LSYQQIIRVLYETGQVMLEIDEVMGDKTK